MLWGTRHPAHGRYLHDKEVDDELSMVVEAFRAYDIDGTGLIPLPQLRHIMTSGQVSHAARALSMTSALQLTDKHIDELLGPQRTANPEGLINYEVCPVCHTFVLVSFLSVVHKSLTAWVPPQEFVHDMQGKYPSGQSSVSSF